MNIYCDDNQCEAFLLFDPVCKKALSQTAQPTERASKAYLGYFICSELSNISVLYKASCFLL